MSATKSGFAVGAHVRFKDEPDPDSEATITPEVWATLRGKTATIVEDQGSAGENFMAVLMGIQESEELLAVRLDEENPTLDQQREELGIDIGDADSRQLAVTSAEVELLEA